MKMKSTIILTILVIVVILILIKMVRDRKQLYNVAGDIKIHIGQEEFENLPQTCDEGYEKIGRLCYPKCESGFQRSGITCTKPCPYGYRDDGLYCAKPAPFIKKTWGFIFGDNLDGSSQWNRCMAETRTGCNWDTAGVVWETCPAGFTNYGVGCSPSCQGLKDIGVSCVKDQQSNNDPHSLKCAPGQETYYAPIGAEITIDGVHIDAGTNLMHCR